MCNLNFLIKTSTEEDNDLLTAYNSACFNSFVSNSDSEGFYFDSKNTIITSEEKINLNQNKDLFNYSNFVLGHERISTSGFNIDYAQPFKKNGFVFIHNGVVSDYDRDGHSDTFNLFNNFLKHFSRYSKKNKRPTALKRSIEKILKNKYGSFSIGIFDIENKTLYYFKNDKTKISGILSEDKSLFYLTTQNYNTEFLNIYNPDLKEFEIKDNTLYFIKITKRNKISIKTHGALNFKEHKTAPIPTKQFTFNIAPDPAQSINQRTDPDPAEIFNIEHFKRIMNIKKNDIAVECRACSDLTSNSSGDYGGIYCDQCLSDYENINYTNYLK